MANEKLVTRETAKKVISGFQEKLEDGAIVPLITKELEALSEDSGTTQETPFINQGTATSNNDSSASVDTGPTGKQLEKQGNTVCVNQLVENGNFADNTGWSVSNVTLSVSNNVATITHGQLGSDSIYSSLALPIKGHKYLICYDAYASSSGLRCGYGYGGVVDVYPWTCSTSKQRFSAIITATQDTSSYRYATVYVRDSGTYYVSNVQVIDLTQWFNGDIPQDLLDNSSHWSWYQNYGDYITYNTGELVNCAGRYLECGASRNAWDEEWEVGNINDYGNNGDETNRIRSKNYIPAIPNTQYYCRIPNPYSFKFFYYDKDKNYLGNSGGFNTSRVETTPSNCAYVRFSTSATYGTTYNHDITISLYYATGTDYNQYYPYEEPKVYDTGTEVLRKIPVAGGTDIVDTKLPSGSITHNVGSYTFTGNETWTSYGSGYETSVLQDQKAKDVLGNIKPNAISSTYLEIKDRNAIYSGTSGISVYLQKIFVSNTSNLTGKTIYYELDKPTTEQGTPFAEVIEINDMSYMAWKDTSNALVSIPQGCKIFYPAWYVGFIDSLGQREDINWVAEEIVSKQWLSDNGYVKQVDISSKITAANATLTIKRAYQFGNMVSLSLTITSGASTIAASTALATFDSSLTPTDTSVNLIGIKSSGFCRVIIDKNSHNLYSTESFEANANMYINATYLIS